MTLRRVRSITVVFVSLAISIGMSWLETRADPYVWVNIGPYGTSTPSALSFFRGGVNGRGTALAVNPADDLDVWLGTAEGGMWHSTDGGVSWASVSENERTLAIGSIALADCTPSCGSIYVGTGENGIRRDTYSGEGLLVGSISGGAVSWQLRTGDSSVNFKHGSIFNVVLDPNTSGASRVIYVALSSGVTASASEATVTAPEPAPGGPNSGYGIYKSTNNGISWQKMIIPGSSTSSGNGRPTDLEMDPTHPEILYAGFLGRGIFRTADGGSTWCPLDPGIPPPAGCNQFPVGLPDPTQATFDHVQVALDRGAGVQGPLLHMYATFGMCPNSLVPDCEPSVYESSNGGSTWFIKHAGTTAAFTEGGLQPCPKGYTRYTHALAVAPGSPGGATLLLGGVHLCRSDDHGATWSLADTNTLGCVAGEGCITHADHHAIVFAGSGLRAYDANDGGVAFSTQAQSQQWSEWTPGVKGLSTFEFQSLVTSKFNPGVALGGAQDNAAMMWTGGKQWTFEGCCGDGGFAVMEDSSGDYFHPHGGYAYVTSNVGAPGTEVLVPIRAKDATTWETADTPSKLLYDQGIKDSTARSFYPPLIEGPAFIDDSQPQATEVANLYFGTQRLWTSLDLAQTWTSVTQGPLVANIPEPEIPAGVDVITAIAVAPSDKAKIYVGTYSGNLLASTSGSCILFNNPSNICPALGRPAGVPVTWIAVDPTNAQTAYATLSGFYSGSHVLKTTNGGTSWFSLPTHPDIVDVPANTITVDPFDPSMLWLGTDIGVYRSPSTNGNSWHRFGFGMPRVPVYAISVDQWPDKAGRRVIAATHGRGAYIATPEHLQIIQGPLTGPAMDQAVVGGGFRSSQSCTMRLIREDGSVCASGSTDALGGVIGTDASGFLVSSVMGVNSNLSTVWACAHGKCLGSDAKKCNQPGNGLSLIAVSCGGQTAARHLTMPAPAPDAPSSSLLLYPRPNAPPSSGMFSVLPTIRASDGSTHTLCSVNVPFDSAETPAIILVRAADAINSDGACLASGVSAVFHDGAAPGEAEDNFPSAASLGLLAPEVNGQKLIPAMRSTPGQATGLCFVAAALRTPVAGLMESMKTEFSTPPGGAQGGTLTLTERSGMGECAIPVSIPAGASAAGIASAVAAAFQSPGIPGPFATCPSDVNPRDVAARGNAVLTAYADEVEVCTTDPAIGIALLPAETCLTNADCDDGNPCTQDVCLPATGRCQSTPVPDGQACDDGNPCTTGNTCQNGSCGAPVVCGGGTPCAPNVCDPATGACVSQPTGCDDANACTQDSCDAASGQCAFSPLPAGASCNDGDPCTTADACTLVPGNPIPVCQGAPKCADADACTADVCDAATGTCSHPPIQCDDGNPCTIDMCGDGTCTSTPVIGAACDTGNLCMTGGTCQTDPFTGAPACVAQPVNCDDGDACTGDSCDPTTGGCMHLTLAQSEVPNGFQFTSASSMTWPAVSGASFYNTYRGTIPQHMMGSRPPAGPLYDQTCFEYDDAFGDGATISTDAATPPLGTGFYYLVSEATGCGESGIGSNSNNTPIPNSNPCSDPAPPALQIVKSHSGNFTQGQTGANYFIVVSNIGPGPSYGTVTVTDLAPSGLTLVSMAGPGWSCPASPGNTCTRSDTLGPGLAYPPITVTVNVSSSATSPQINKAEVSGGGAPTATSNDSTNIITLAPALGIAKTHSGNFHRGQTGATYSVTVSNTGNAPTSGTVTVTENPPGGFTNVVLSGTGWTCPTPGNTCTRSDALAPGGSYPVITVTLDVAPDAPLPTLTNQVTASGGGSPTASASDPTTIDYPLLAMIKHHTGNFVQGQQGAIFLLSVQDQGLGPTAGTTVTVTENTPTGLTLVSMAGTGWTCPVSPGNVCTRSDVLASTASWPDITVTMNVATNAPSTLINVATISGGGSVGTGVANDFVTIDTGRITLGITKTHTGNFVQGQPHANYTLSVHNGGNLATSGTVTVTENAPSGLTLLSMSGTGWTCPTPGNTCTRGDALAPGANYPDITVDVSVAPNAPSSVTNQATVTGGGDGSLHTASDPTTINPGPPVLSVTKTHNGNFSQGQTNAKYFVTITNLASQATGGQVMMMEQPPPGLTVVSMAGTGWTCDTVQCHRPDPLPGGSSYPVITITVSVAAGATSPQVNQVQVNGGGSPPAGASDSTTIIPAGVPSLSITKTHVGNFAHGQTNATYTVLVSNNIGAGPAAGPVTVNDTFPPGLVPVSMAGTGWSCSPTSCNRNTALAPGASYPPITVTVNVLASATSPQVNQVNVNGGGSAPASSSDSTVISP